MFNVIVVFWALCILCLINMVRYFSSIRVLLTILRQSDPLLYQSVDGNGFFYYAWAIFKTVATYPLY